MSARHRRSNRWLVVLVVFGLCGVVFSGTAMGAEKVKCAIVQVAVTEPEAIIANADRVTELVREAAGQGAALVVCPELTFNRTFRRVQNAVTVTQLAEHFEEVKGRFSVLAAELRVAIVIGVFEPSGDEKRPVFNTALFLGPDGAVLGRHRKVVLADHEYDFAKAGDEADGSATPFATPFGRVGMLISKDMRTTFWPDALAAKGMDLFIGIGADRERGWQMVAHGCIKGRCPGIAANRCDEPYVGKSGFVSAAGASIRQAGNTPEIIYATLPLASAPPP